MRRQHGAATEPLTEEAVGARVREVRVDSVADLRGRYIERILEKRPVVGVVEGLNVSTRIIDYVRKYISTAL